MRLNRLIRILILLANKNKLTVRELAEKFEVSRKTIYQDLDVLILSDIPVVYGQDYKGTVKLMDGFNLPKAFVNEIEPPKRPFSEDVYIKYTNNEQSMKHTLNLWENFMQRREIDMTEMDESIFHSWIRCQQQNTPIHEVDPDNLLSPEEVDAYRIENVLGEKLGKGLLFLKIFEQLDWFAMIYNNDGMLESIINPFKNYDLLYPQLGYFRDAKEQRIGTNAAGLALVENRAVKVCGAEHYNKTFHEGTCIAAPLYKNEIRCGILTVAFVHTNVNPQVVHIVNSFARMYEALILSQHPISQEKEKRLYDKEAVPLSAAVPKLSGVSLHWESVMSVANYFSIMPHHVAILGERGVGKQSLARYIHAKSSRKYAPCLLLDGASPDTQAWREEIFGFERKGGESLGLFEKAEGGVLIIRSPQLLPEDIQLALAQYLKTSKIRRIGSRKAAVFNTRIIMTLPSLDMENLHEALRQELFLTVTLQPLRTRKEDIHAIYKSWVETLTDDCKSKREHIQDVSCIENDPLCENITTLKTYFNRFNPN